MKNAWWKTCTGGFAAAVFCVAACAPSFGAEAKSLDEMEKELNALKATISGLSEQIEVVKQEKSVAANTSSDTKEDVAALKNEVTTLKEEMRAAAQAAPTLKGEDIAGNVYSEFAKKVKLGGSIRTRAEYANGLYQVPTSNSTLGNATGIAGRGTATDDDYILNQTRIWADADVNEHLRMFIQIQDARVFGAEGTTVGYAQPRYTSTSSSTSTTTIFPPSTTTTTTTTTGVSGSTSGPENSIMDIHQGYFDLKKLFDLPLTVRVGRQEIIWGDHRVIGNFVWSNVGRTFDGGRFMWDTDAIHAEAFAVKVDEGGLLFNSAGTATNDDNSDENIYAAQFAFKKLVPGALLELMYIQKNDQDSVTPSNINGFGNTAANAGGNIVIHDVGVRIDGKVPNLDAIDYTVESHGQFGDFADQTQRAWAFAGRTGYTFKNLAWTPRIGIEYDYASGDEDTNDNTHQTFDNLYPTNHWQGNYGFADLLSWQNMHDARMNIKVAPTKKLTAQVDYHYYWVASEVDGWYLANGTLATGGTVANRAAGGFQPGGNNLANDLAQEVDLTVSYDLYKNVKILAGYSFFESQSWMDQNVGDVDTNWMYLQTTVTF